MLLRQVETFVQVARLGSFTRAAGALFVTPAAVMKQMNDLERTVGVELLTRSSHGAGLTDAGRAFYADAVPLLAHASEMVEHARAAAGLVQTTVRIGTATTANPNVVPREVWAALRAAHPEIRLEFVPFDESVEGIGSVLETMGPKGPFDCIVSVNDSTSRKRAFGFLELGLTPLRLAAPQGHPLAGRAQVAPEDLAGETVMMTAAGDAPHVDAVRAHLAAHHPDVRVSDGPRYYDMATFNAAEQQGVLLLATDAWGQAHPGLVMLPVSWDFAVPYGVTHAREPEGSVRRFLDAIAEAVRACAQG